MKSLVVVLGLPSSTHELCIYKLRLSKETMDTVLLVPMVIQQPSLHHTHTTLFFFPTPALATPVTVTTYTGAPWVPTLTTYLLLFLISPALTYTPAPPSLATASLPHSLTQPLYPQLIMVFQPRINHAAVAPNSYAASYNNGHGYYKSAPLVHG